MLRLLYSLLWRTDGRYLLSGQGPECFRNQVRLSGDHVFPALRVHHVSGMSKLVQKKRNVESDLDMGMVMVMEQRHKAHLSLQKPETADKKQMPW